MMITNKKSKSYFLKSVFNEKSNFNVNNLSRSYNYLHKRGSSFSSTNYNFINNQELDKTWLEIEYDNTELEEGGRI